MRAFMSETGWRPCDFARADEALCEARRIVAETEPIIRLNIVEHDANGPMWPRDGSREALADALRAFVGEE